jgi:hypothetical protein
MQTNLFAEAEATATNPKERYPPWDKEKKFPFMFNQYWANAETENLTHANSLFLNYNCKENDIIEVSGRVICNTVEEIKAAFKEYKSKGYRKKTFTILSKLSEGLEEFNYLT